MGVNHVKCECGHINPEGTVLCEACGKPIEKNQHIDGNEGKKLLNMRYDGASRRSQTYNQSIVDKIWNFFSSVRNGVILIVIALLASGIGTIFPQEMYIPEEAADRNPAVFYEDWYGIFGKIYYQLGLHNLYSSWWYMLLIALIGVSLVICSIDRFVPLRRALKMQKPKRHYTFLSRQRLFSNSGDVSEEDKKKVVERLKKKRYKITDENGYILAEKNRFSRWGPYVNHIGLIIVLLAALVRMSPIMFLDDYVWVREGEEKVIPSTDGEYFIENKKFTLETYDAEDEENEKFKDAIEEQGMIEKNYQTDAVIYKAKDKEVVGEEEELEKVKEGSLQMNKPMKFGGYTLYQSGYQENEFSDMTFGIYETDDEDGDSLGEVTIDTLEPDTTYETDSGFEVEVVQYYPEYEMKDGEPRSVSKFPRNPAFVLEVTPPDSDEEELSFVGIGKNIDATGENDYKMKIKDYNQRFVSGITVRKDYTIPFFIIGAAIFLIGVMQGMYWYHRRIWINPDKKGMLLAAHTNKNWFGIKKDIEYAIEGTSFEMVTDQEEEKEMEDDNREV
ncbi:MAG TPA: cytochrome c biogenesis protein ResB [Pseudogracilibacillus sp.]|nr:cytochrome c biogenesis protein ResB [Pseudogracilibacillus sp.]